MARQKILKENILSIVRHFASRLDRAGIDHQQLIVFGSQARGTSKPWSDIDLCVVSDQFGKDRHSERVKLMLARDHDSLDIEPHPYNSKDLEEKYDPLAAEIRKYGIRVA